jgi:hypothetical protein
MQKVKLKLIHALLIALILTVMRTPYVYAHPGGTDADGGHHCWTNCSSWGYSYGEYHYHYSVQSLGSPVGTAFVLVTALSLYYLSYKRSENNK